MTQEEVTAHVMKSKEIGLRISKEIFEGEDVLDIAITLLVVQETIREMNPGVMELAEEIWHGPMDA